MHPDITDMVDMDLDSDTGMDLDTDMDTDMDTGMGMEFLNTYTYNQPPKYIT